MPLYSFSCDKCGHIFDTFKSVELRASAQCPECNSEARRRYTPFSYSFGWKLSDESLNDVTSTKPDTMVRNI